MNQCKHENYDEYFDKCSDCGFEPESFTSCEYCEWFGIPVVDGMALEFCNDSCELAFNLESEL